MISHKSERPAKRRASRFYGRYRIRTYDFHRVSQIKMQMLGLNLWEKPLKTSTFRSLKRNFGCVKLQGVNPVSL